MGSHSAKLQCSMNFSLIFSLLKLWKKLRIWVDEVHQPNADDYPCQVDFPGASRACSRWLFGTECLALQGFPVHPSMDDFAISPFNFERERKCRTICSQAGNSMHVVCPFICSLHSAVCWRMKDDYNRTS